MSDPFERMNDSLDRANILCAEIIELQQRIRRRTWYAAGVIILSLSAVLVAGWMHP